MESRIISEARRCGVPTPIVLDVDSFSLTMEHVEGAKLKDLIDPALSEGVGELVGRLHSCGIVHGDLTTSNMTSKGRRSTSSTSASPSTTRGSRPRGGCPRIFPDSEEHPRPP
jgi:Kae1-associated kinase Bud32